MAIIYSLESGNNDVIKKSIDIAVKALQQQTGIFTFILYQNYYYIQIQQFHHQICHHQYNQSFTMNTSNW
jgi:hypothetical protein